MTSSTGAVVSVRISYSRSTVTAGRGGWSPLEDVLETLDGEIVDETDRQFQLRRAHARQAAGCGRSRDGDLALPAGAESCAATGD